MNKIAAQASQLARPMSRLSKMEQADIDTIREDCYQGKTFGAGVVIPLIGIINRLANGEDYPPPDPIVVAVAQQQAREGRGDTIDEILERLGDTNGDCSVAYAGLGFFCEPMKKA
jgi:hypothetical protein